MTNVSILFKLNFYSTLMDTNKYSEEITYPISFKCLYLDEINLTFFSPLNVEDLDF